MARVQSFTFCASSHPVTYLGATPVFVDSESETWNIDPELLGKAIEERVAKTGRKPKAIVPVALYGMPYKIDEIMAVADDHIAHHKHVCQLYKELLVGIEGIDLHENTSSRYDSNYWLCTIRLNPYLHVKGEEHAYKTAVQGVVGGTAGVTMSPGCSIRPANRTRTLRRCV